MTNGDDDGPGSLRAGLAASSNIDRGRRGYTLLELTEGASLRLDDRNFTIGGGYTVSRPGGGKGIFVNVPLDRTGIARLTLTNVAVTGVGRHGIHVSDCDAVPCGAGVGGGGNGDNAIEIEEEGAGDLAVNGERPGRPATARRASM